MGNSPSMEYWNWPWAPADEVLIEAVEAVGRLQRSDHIRKAVNYVRILLEKGADPNARDEWGIGHAIHYAIWTGNMELVQLLVEHEFFNMDADTGQFFRGYEQFTRPIHMAAYEARPDLMRLLLARRAATDCPDKKGRTPVQCVLAPTLFDGEALAGRPRLASLRQRQTLQALVERGSDVNRPFLASSVTAIPFKELVRQCPTALHLACDRGDLELVKVLLAGRIDINGEAHEDAAASPMQIAVERGDLELVKLLKKAGANADTARMSVASKLQHLRLGAHSRSASAVQLGASSEPAPDRGRGMEDGASDPGADPKGKQRSMAQSAPLHRSSSSWSSVSGGSEAGASGRGQAAPAAQRAPSRHADSAGAAGASAPSQARPPRLSNGGPTAPSPSRQTLPPLRQGSSARSPSGGQQLQQQAPALPGRAGGQQRGSRLPVSTPGLAGVTSAS